MTDAVEVLRIDSLNDERLDAYVRLTERELRCVLEPQKGIFIAESAKVIERAVRAGYEPVSFLLGERWLDQMMPLFERLVVREGAGPVPVFVASMELMEQLTGFNVTRGALAAFRRPRQIPVDEFLGGVVEVAGERPVRVCVLEGIVDHTNVGAIFRSAAALNVDGILVSPTCCDPLYRRSARVSMGTVFQVPWAYFGSGEAADVAQLKALGFRTAAMALRDDAVSIDDARLAAEERLAIVLGTEGDGLARETIADCDYTVRIPMSHGVDSLNVAAASAVAFWQLCAQGAPAKHNES